MTVRVNVGALGHRDQAPKTCACCGTLVPPDAPRIKGVGRFCPDRKECRAAYLVAKLGRPKREED